MHAVEQVSFDLVAGETLALVGESGCGKSTTGRSLLRLVESQRRQRSSSTAATSRELPHRRAAGAAARHPVHLPGPVRLARSAPDRRLLDRRAAAASTASPSGAEAQQRVRWLLEKVGLPPEHAQRYPHEFSGGQRQRIAIARALALQPKVIVADEAVSALDVSIQAQIVNLHARPAGASSASPILFISHDMAVVERISHRVAVMYLGPDRRDRPAPRGLRESAARLHAQAAGGRAGGRPGAAPPRPARCIRARSRARCAPSATSPASRRWSRSAPAISSRTHRGRTVISDRSPQGVPSMNNATPLPHRRGAGASLGLAGCRTCRRMPPRTSSSPSQSSFTTTDPYDANDTLSQAMAKSFYEGLYGFDKDMKMMPVLAESYTVSKDGLVYTIKLRTRHQVPRRHRLQRRGGEGQLRPRDQSRTTSSSATASTTNIAKTEAVDDDHGALHAEEPFSPFINNARASVGRDDLARPRSRSAAARTSRSEPGRHRPVQVRRVEGHRLPEGREVRRLLEEGLPEGRHASPGSRWSTTTRAPR